MRWASRTLLSVEAPGWPILGQQSLLEPTWELLGREEHTASHPLPSRRFLEKASAPFKGSRHRFHPHSFFPVLTPECYTVYTSSHRAEKHYPWAPLRTT